jgi:hypothetical protein
MRLLVTGSAGHLGEALVRVLGAEGHEVVGLDVLDSPHTAVVGSIADRAVAREAVRGADAVLHAATLHKPHVATHTRQEFVDTNITGTLNLLEEAAAAGIRSFVFTSTTSVYGRAMNPPAGAPATWVTEELTPLPKNIYGVTKLAAEGLCELFHFKFKLPCVVLRTSRFFPEEDDDADRRARHADANIKANEFLYRRADIEGKADIVEEVRGLAKRAHGSEPAVFEELAARLLQSHHQDSLYASGRVLHGSLPNAKRRESVSYDRRELGDSSACEQRWKIRALASSESRIAQARVGRAAQGSGTRGGPKNKIACPKLD